MADLFKNKYRVPSARLAGYDYASPGRYFVTICTRDKECWFGMVVNGEIRLSDVGTIACEIWQEIPARFHDHIIRNEKSLHAIRRYIQNNPAK